MADDMMVGATLLRLQKGDIVKAGTEAIVNAANAQLAGGGGVDGAIHDAAGPELYKMTAKYNGCPTGSAVITGAGQIPAPTRYIIHAVGPKYDSRNPDKSRQLLASAYRSSLELADQNKITSIAFPSLSTGIFGYPIEQAAPVAINAVIDYLKQRAHSGSPSELELVLFVLFSEPDYDIYRRAFDSIDRT